MRRNHSENCERAREGWKCTKHTGRCFKFFSKITKLPAVHENGLLKRRVHVTGKRVIQKTKLRLQRLFLRRERPRFMTESLSGHRIFRRSILDNRKLKSGGKRSCVIHSFNNSDDNQKGLQFEGRPLRVLIILT